MSARGEEIQILFIYPKFGFFIR